MRSFVAAVAEELDVIHPNVWCLTPNVPNVQHETHSVGVITNGTLIPPSPTGLTTWL